MKKTILSAIFIASISCFAQAPRGLYGSVGISQSNLSSSDVLSSPAIGYKFGLNFLMGYHENYNFQAEFLFNNKAIKLKTIGSQTGNLGQETYLSQSLDVGCYFNYYILKPEEDKFFLGPQIGVAASIGGQLSTYNELKEMFDFSDESSGSSDFSNYSDATSFDYTSSESRYLLPYSISGDELSKAATLNFDAGFGLTGGYNNFRFDLRYSKGLNNRLEGAQTNSYDANNQYTGPTLKGKLNTLSFSVSYLIWKRNKRIKK